MDPLHAIDDKFKALAAEIEHRVLVRVIREAANANLSRLTTLDPENAPQYLEAMKAFGE